VDANLSDLLDQFARAPRGVPRPRDGETALIVIDVQERLVPALDAAHRPRFLQATANLVALAAQRGWPIIPTLQYPKGLGPFVPEVARELAAAGAPAAVEKVEFSALRAPGFGEPWGRSGARAAVLVGAEAHVCVLETASDLLERGFTVFLPWDAVASRREEDRRTGLDLARAAGAVVTSSETLIFQCLGRAGTPEFKAMAPRLREA
jgi:nicotinamidase-related amidase